MRLPRMTTRRWTVAVAVTAVVLALGQRWADLRGRAARHRQVAAIYAALAGRGCGLDEDLLAFERGADGVWVVRPASPEAGREWEERKRARSKAVGERSRYHAALAACYERAAWRPWVAAPAERDGTRAESR